MIGTIGVIGAGQMGGGIAHVCALASYSVHLVDVSGEQLERALATIRRNLERQRDKGIIGAGDVDTALSRIRTDTRAAFPDADLVIEAATENEAVKRTLFAEVCPTLKPDAILCSNTSSISITRLAAATDRPERFMGMHFMNPVPVMALVELIRGIATREATVDAVSEVVRAVGKTAVSVADFPAFVLNRILLPMINEAVFTLQDGVASAADIDTTMTLGANHPMGPLALADLIGLDTCLAIMRVLHEGFGDPKYRPCPLLMKYVEAGWTGRKSGRGFHAYQ